MVQIIDNSPSELTLRQRALSDPMNQIASALRNYNSENEVQQKTARQSAMESLKGAAELSKIHGRVITPEEYDSILKQQMNPAKEDSGPSFIDQATAGLNNFSGKIGEALKPVREYFSGPEAPEVTGQDQQVVQGLDYSALGGQKSTSVADNGSQVQAMPPTPQAPRGLKEILASAPKTPSALKAEQDAADKKRRLDNEDTRIKDTEENRNRAQKNWEENQKRFLGQGQAKLNHEQDALDQKTNQDFIKMGESVANSSQRKRIGSLTKQIDTTDQIFAMTNGLGGEAKPNETKAQRVERFNHASEQQYSEAVRTLDRLLSQGAPTAAGTEHLTQPTAEALVAKWKSYLGNVPASSNRGQFLENIMDTVERERKLANTKLEKAVGGLSATYAHLKKRDPQRFQDIIKSASQDESSVGLGGGVVSIPAIGTKLTPEKRAELIKHIGEP